MVTPNVLRPVASWSDPRHRRGLAGELAAARWLECQGWAVLAHRYRLGHHDLDLVVRQADLVAFVEVKARRTDGFGGGRQAVGWRKRLTVELVASRWILEHGRPTDRFRFDLLVVEWDGAGFPHLTHIPDAWRCVRK